MQRVLDAFAGRESFADAIRHADFCKIRMLSFAGPVFAGGRMSQAQQVEVGSVVARIADTAGRRATACNDRAPQNAMTGFGYGAVVEAVIHDLGDEAWAHEADRSGKTPGSTGIGFGGSGSTAMTFDFGLTMKPLRSTLADRFDRSVVAEPSEWSIVRFGCCLVDLVLQFAIRTTAASIAGCSRFAESPTLGPVRCRNREPAPSRRRTFG